MTETVVRLIQHPANKMEGSGSFLKLYNNGKLSQNI